MPLYKALQDLMQHDLQNLVDQKEPESRTLDYKHSQTFPKGNEEAKTEFRKDITALANSAGGDLIVGISDDKGVPKELCGFDLGGQSAEQYKQTLLDVLQSRIKPRVQVTIHTLQLDTGKWVAVVRVPKSYAAPHQIEANTKDFQLWFRHDGSCQRMDIDEVRDAIARAVNFADRARRYREERVAQIKQGTTPVRLQPGAKTVLHLISSDAFGNRASLNLFSAEPSPYRGPGEDRFPRYCGGNMHYNLDGLVLSNRSFVRHEETVGNTYTLVSRSGTIEAVEAHQFEDNRVIPIEALMDYVVDAVTKYSRILAEAGAQPPFVVMLSLIGVGERFLYMPPMLTSWNPLKALDRADLFLPEVIVNDSEMDTAKVLHPVFDALWQAFNYRGCPFYDEAGAYDGAGVTKRLRLVDI